MGVGAGPVQPHCQWHWDTCGHSWWHTYDVHGVLACNPNGATRVVGHVHSPAALPSILLHECLTKQGLSIHDNIDAPHPPQL